MTTGRLRRARSRHRACLAGGALGTVVLSLLTTGCATPPPNPGRTTVILLPDQEGHVGGVSVTSAAGRRELDEPYGAVTVAGSRTVTMEGTPADRAPTVTRYQDLLATHPTRPRNLVLYFVLDTTTLTERSKALLPEVFQAARERKPTEITVYGHADGIGPERRNLVLSEQRARAIAELLKKSDPTLGEVRVQYFGDKVPLVPAVANAPEPRNRRVEVEIL